MPHPFLLRSNVAGGDLGDPCLARDAFLHFDAPGLESLDFGWVVRQEPDFRKAEMAHHLYRKRVVTLVGVEAEFLVRLDGRRG